MYTGSYHPATKRSKRLFGVAVLVLLLCVLILIAGIAAVFITTDIRFNLFPDGVIVLGTEEASTALRAAQGINSEQTGRDPILIVDIPEPPFEIITDISGRIPLSNEVLYDLVVDSVTGIVAGSPYGESTGSGMVMSADGYIITNQHVVDGATSVKVVLNDGTVESAEIIGTDRITDLAVLRVDRDDLKPVEFGNSDALRVGQSVLAIGNPLGMDLQNSMTNGIVSGINRDITLEDSSGEITMTVIQTNCAVNPGNSGGPLFNQYGQVVGIVSSKIMGSTAQSVEGLGFAIPLNTAAPVLAELRDVGYVRGRPALGITVRTDIILDSTTTGFYGLPAGIIITDVNPASDCYAQGVRAEDILTHVNGTAVSSLAEVNAIKNQFLAGDSIDLTLYRQGETFTVTVRLMEEGEVNR